MMTTPKNIMASAAAICAISITAPAMANNMTETSKTVAYEDLNLTSAAGQERFQQRVNKAVKRVCATPRAFTLKEKWDQKRCENKARASAMKSTKTAIAQAYRSQRLAVKASPIVAGN